jgi:predicted O-methyltransferase YrrM
MNCFFRKILRPYIKTSGYRAICEIGASEGANTEKLATLKGVHITVVDPCLDKDLVKHYGHLNNIAVINKLSLEILPGIGKCFDCILIDGDHNWYTVFNELLTIHEKGLIRKGGTIFLHDVLWPYARRDMYYAPETIPQEFRQAYAKKGIDRFATELLNEGGMNPLLFNAMKCGGPRNGVLTAVEDFLKKYENEYEFLMYKAEYGLGCLIRKGSLKQRVVSWIYRLKILFYETGLAVKTFLRSIRKGLRG